ncbi:cryptochrome/photolyase family protein [Aquirufa nivalisilvae]|uniref:cryptochrome/photolyase family protein n=1 Tax=Aquirufa nivalisilvae TaxID=2516557 RepID=UPI001032A704|nr:deoxyribodipyrimidine photo-lyase [Aquirufa nivalisilvae]TBH73608.1 deoxyribodipyrimidine photo-lyase [Aquirufa nivalisilvae]
MNEISVFWFRRDLRIKDNVGLFEALSSAFPVLPIFIFDPNILDKLENKKDARVEFIHEALANLKSDIQERGGDLMVLHDNPLSTFKSLAQHYTIKHIYTNHDYESYAIQRDSDIKTWAEDLGISFHSFKDQVIFEKDEVLTGQNTPYTVFTPYSRKWKEKLANTEWRQFESENLSNYVRGSFEMPALNTLGFQPSGFQFPSLSFSDDIIRQYQVNRDYPGLDATSHASVHLRFGTVSIRELVKRALGKSETWLNELIWRDFYFNITFHFPHIGQGLAFRKEYDRMKWRNNEQEFEAWKNGQTGYPIVDAGMRELNQTGFMHNRVRMIVASFLVKHLLIDWRWGEAYFAEKLLDFDFSANNGGWQWAAGSGCDAAPYFRVFNPYLQTQKFDKELSYIRKWVPEFQEFHYPKPIVDHEFARKRVLAAYKEALG